jgi:hypothetical protein
MMSLMWSRKNAGQDLRAGLVLGVESIPDGLAAGLLAGTLTFTAYGYATEVATDIAGSAICAAGAPTQPPLPAWCSS